MSVNGASASAFSFWMHVKRGTTDAPELPTLGYYNDTLVKEGGRRRYFRREVFRNIPAG